MKTDRWIICIICAFFLSGCQPNDAERQDAVEDNLVAGPCVHLYQDEVLHIVEASGTATGAVIGQVDLSNFVVNGSVRSNESIIQSRASNIVSLADVLRCTLPCSFGVESGEWEFTAEAAGYKATAQTLEASYTTFEGGCPSFEDGGTHVTITLDENL